MSGPENPAPKELPLEPFEGLDVYSSPEELALAGMWQQLLDLPETSEPDQSNANTMVQKRVLTYQFNCVAQYLGKYHPGYERPIEEGLEQWLTQERTSLRNDHNITYSELDPASIIFARAYEARWKIAGVNPSNLSGQEKRALEEAWGEAARATLDFKLAALKMEREQLIVENQLHEILNNGVGVEGFTEKYADLSEQMWKIKRPDSGGTAGWGTGDPTR